MAHESHEAPSPVAAAAGEAPLDLTERIRRLRDVLGAQLVERDVAIRLALLAALAGEHLLLVGPPGTAKSLVARRLRLAFSESSYFERLLTRFTVPEELFGPLSIKGLEEDRYERLTASYLPAASIAFLDEIFKANSAILNALLTLLNEREFDNGSRRVKTPLLAVVGASNELPEGEELDALFDRFLLRLHVGPVTKQAFPALLALRGQADPDVPEALKLSGVDLDSVRARAEEIEVPDDVAALLRDLREWCTAEEIPVSDRRWRKVVKLLQVSALTCGRDRVSVWDCWLLQHCLWDEPEKREKAYDWYAARVGASAAMDPSRLTKVVVAWEGKLKRDQESRSQARDDEGQLLYVDGKGKQVPDAKGLLPAARNGEPLYLAQPEWFDENGQQVGQKRVANAGRGLLRADLDKLWVSRDHWGDGTVFAQWSEREKYLQTPGARLMVEGPHSPVMEATRHKPAYMADALRQVGEIRSRIVEYQGKLDRHVADLEAQIRSHLWVTPDFADPASRSLLQTRREVETLLARIDQVRDGYGLLPREVEPDASASSATDYAEPKPAKKAGRKSSGA